MYRLTTPSLLFNLPIDTDTLEEAYVTIRQKQKEKDEQIEKTIEDCTLEEKSLKVSLTQAETALFIAGERLEIQLRVKDKNGNAYASRIFSLPCEAVLKEDII